MTAPAGEQVVSERTAAPASVGRRRRITTWVVIAAVLIGVGIVGTLLAGIGQWSERDALDPESAGPAGTRALVEILREQGVEVVVVRDRAAAAGGARRRASEPGRRRRPRPVGRRL